MSLAINEPLTSPLPLSGLLGFCPPESLRERGIDLVVLKQDIDTTAPAGPLAFRLLAAIGEWQRELIVEGTHEGLAAARARGRAGGRKPKLTPAQVKHARKLYEGGEHTVAYLRALPHPQSRQIRSRRRYPRRERSWSTAAASGPATWAP